MDRLGTMGRRQRDVLEQQLQDQDRLQQCGQVLDRGHTPPSSAQATKFRAHQATNCPTAMMPLTADWTALHNKVNAMTPTGNTNVTIGMAWA